MSVFKIENDVHGLGKCLFEYDVSAVAFIPPFPSPLKTAVQPASAASSRAFLRSASPSDSESRM